MERLKQSEIAKVCPSFGGKKSLIAVGVTESAKGEEKIEAVGIPKSELD